MTWDDIAGGLTALGSITTAVVVFARAHHERQQTRRLQADLALRREERDGSREARDAGTIAGQAARIAELEEQLAEQSAQLEACHGRERALAEEVTGRTQAHGAQRSPLAHPPPRKDPTK